MEYTIEISNLMKEYPLVKKYRDIIIRPFAQNKITALEDVSFSVKKGELFGLLGPNGAGKTTLLKILATLILPDKGTIKINGIEIEKNPKSVKHLIGFVVNEERSFFWRLTGRQNLEFFAVLNNIKKKHIRDKVDTLLNLIGLDSDANRMFKDYSAGMKQRLAIARSLLTEPDILIMDEPTKSLDPVASKKLRTFIKEELVMKKGKTVCLSTHNLSEAENICSRIAIIHKGRLLACDSPENIKSLISVSNILEICVKKNAGKDTHEAMQKILLNTGYKLESYSEKTDSLKMKIAIFENSGDIFPAVREFSKAGFTVTSCQPVKISLEEAFDRIVN